MNGIDEASTYDINYLQAMAYTKYTQVSNDLSTFLIDVGKHSLNLLKVSFPDTSIFQLPVWIEEIYDLQSSNEKKEQLIYLNYLLADLFSATDRLLWDIYGSKQSLSISSTMGIVSYMLTKCTGVLSSFVEENKKILPYFSLFLEETWAAIDWEETSFLEIYNDYDNENIQLLGRRYAWLKIGPMIVAMLANREADVQKLSDMLDSFLTATVLENSIMQWGFDLQIKRRTYVQALLLEARPSLRETHDGGLTNESILIQLNVLDHCNKLFEEALVGSSELGSISFSQYISLQLSLINSQRSILQTKLNWLDQKES